MKKLKDILAELLDKIKEREGEDEMRRKFQEVKELGIEAMNREVIVQLLNNHFNPEERERYFTLCPDLKLAYENRLR